MLDDADDLRVLQRKDDNTIIVRLTNHTLVNLVNLTFCPESVSTVSLLTGSFTSEMEGKPVQLKLLEPTVALARVTMLTGKVRWRLKEIS